MVSIDAPIPKKSIQTEYSFDTKLNFEPFFGLKYLIYSFT